MDPDVFINTVAFLIQQLALALLFLLLCAQGVEWVFRSEHERFLKEDEAYPAAMLQRMRYILLEGYVPKRIALVVCIIGIYTWATLLAEVITLMPLMFVLLTQYI